MRLFFSLLIMAYGIQPLSAQPRLDSYIRSALESHESIIQQKLALSKSEYAYQEAKSLSLPQVTFMAGYTLASGGRTVDIPVGDLLNPAYKTLNELTGSANFPSLDNQRILLNPDNFYDVKLRTSYSLINKEIDYNRKIKYHEKDLYSLETDIVKRDIIKEIKLAYFNYLRAGESILIYESAIGLVKENLRINNSLYRNEKINRTTVIRSEHEVDKYNAWLESARQEQANARSYFNFLLNRNAEEEIAADSILLPPPLNRVLETSGREELGRLKKAGEINNTLADLNRSNRLPKLSSFLDLGSQAFDFNVNSQSVYYLFGLSLEWNLFSGFKNKYKARQIASDSKTIESKLRYVQSQLELQLTTAGNSYRSSLALYHSSFSQVSSAERYYKDLLRLYKEGQALYIELLDAQNQWTSAKLQAAIYLYDTWIKAAEIERANATYHLNESKQTK